MLQSERNEYSYCGMLDVVLATSSADMLRSVDKEDGSIFHVPRCRRFDVSLFEIVT